MPHFALLAAALTAVAAIAAAQTAAPAQPPWKGKNLQFFPQDITREALIQRMREFSFALGVRCQYCHVGGDGVSFEGVAFESDDKPAKVKARAMLRMVDQLNGTILPQIPSRAEPRVQVGCVTCHRGLALPKSLQTTLLEVVEKDGAAAAVARYRELRAETMTLGQYNFGEWEINELARRLFEMDRTADAIAILEMNGEFYPKSAAIDFQLGELHRKRGERDKAVARYRAALAKAPEHPMVKQRLDELEKK
ncbi:MAG TPA: c-type cytochrome [Vicinamibacterales bacterium]|jgi:tetratricopeptide (TPR) repeat protein|nr:c-type cytochrome [Vicinamibacterales bacterium]